MTKATNAFLEYYESLLSLLATCSGAGLTANTIEPGHHTIVGLTRRQLAGAIEATGRVLDRTPQGSEVFTLHTETRHGDVVEVYGTQQQADTAALAFVVQCLGDQADGMTAEQLQAVVEDPHSHDGWGMCDNFEVEMVQLQGDPRQLPPIREETTPDAEEVGTDGRTPTQARTDFLQEAHAVTMRDRDRLRLELDTEQATTKALSETSKETFDVMKATFILQEDRIKELEKEIEQTKKEVRIKIFREGRDHAFGVMKDALLDSEVSIRLVEVFWDKTKEIMGDKYDPHEDAKIGARRTIKEGIKRELAELPEHPGDNADDDTMELYDGALTEGLENLRDHCQELVAEGE